ncbi:MAG TPA: GNAT family N-acetyltransferase [Tepidisphaeraceae bacterium]|nr:GNAT family N-acetyltransferase [Tepidisphaeraceae bacterium]
MNLSAHSTSLEEIAPLRELYRAEMNCQIMFDSLHTRPGWTQSYLLLANGDPAGYGSIALAGPWKDKPTAFEFFILPQHRLRIFDLFETFLRATNPIAIETQSNGTLLHIMLHTYAKNITAEAILYHDKVTTTHVQPNVIFRPAIPYDRAQITAQNLDESAEFVLELDHQIVATGGILYHYNPPYGDLFMSVAESHRRRGLGSFLIQELKRTCYQLKHIPAARCNVDNIPSRKTLQKSGFVPCGNILTGTLQSRT